jgi:hypothetical protein
LATIMIDGKEYDSETLPPGIKDHLRNLHVTDTQLKEINLQLSIVQAARDTYVKALRDLVSISDLLERKEKQQRR